MDRALQNTDANAMTLRCVFHVSAHSPAARPLEPKPRPRLPSMLDLDIEYVDERPRGASFETWNRARGWSTED
jgi:hypothetical protein